MDNPSQNTKPMSFENAIKILHLDVVASKSEMRKAFRKLVVQNHPDKFIDDVDKEVAAKNFRRIKEAYAFLMNLEPVVLKRRTAFQTTGTASTAPKFNINLGSQDSVYWSEVTSTQEQLVKLVATLFVATILCLIVLFNGEKILDAFSHFF